MSFVRGMADGQLIGRAMRAESGAASASAEADDANRRANKEAAKATLAEMDAHLWEKKARELHKLLRAANGSASAGLIVMNALIKIMDEMSPPQRDLMKEKLVNIARARIITLDNELRNTPNFVDIEAQMRALPANKVLGIV